MSGGVGVGMPRERSATARDVAQPGRVEAQAAVRTAADDVAVVVVLAVVVPPALAAALVCAAFAERRVPAARARERAARARREHVVLGGVPGGPTLPRLCQPLLLQGCGHG